MNCPHCQGTKVRRSQRRNVFENALSGLGLRPWRCLDCQARFFRFRPRQPNRMVKDHRGHDRWWWKRLPASTKVQIVGYAAGAVLILALLGWLASGGWGG